MIYGTDLDSQPSSIDLNGMTAHTGYIIAGSWGGDQLGTAVADGGDVNHDCNDSILIGDPNAGPNGEPQSGTVYVVYGTPRGLNPQEYVSTLQQNGQGYRIDGPTTGARYGTSVANAGDIDGDGTPDVIAGAPNWNGGAGEAIITYGENKNNALGINTGSLSSSGNPLYGYTIQGHTQDYTVNGTLGTEVPWTGHGGISPQYSDDPSNTCQYFTAGAYFQGAYPNATSVTAEGDRTGTSVAGLGDVNGDGVADVLVSSPGWNDSAGAVSVIYGLRGRNQDNIQLYSNGQGLATSVGYTISDGNIPTPESGPALRSRRPMDQRRAGGPGGGADPGGCGREPARVPWWYSNSTQGWVYCSNYMWEPGDQAGSSAAARPRELRSDRRSHLRDHLLAVLERISAEAHRLVRRRRLLTGRPDEGPGRPPGSAQLVRGRRPQRRSRLEPDARQRRRIRAGLLTPQPSILPRGSVRQRRTGPRVINPGADPARQRQPQQPQTRVGRRAL